MAAEGIKKTAELVEQCKAGDQNAWCLLVCRFTPLVLALLRSRGFQDADTEDICQNVWLRVCQKLSRYDPSKGEFGAWLCRVAINEGRSSWRSNRHNKTILFDDDDGLLLKDTLESALPAKDLLESAAEMEQTLKSALRSLSGAERFVIEGRLRHGMTLESCGKSLGKANSTALTLYRSGLREIRRFVIVSKFKTATAFEKNAFYEQEVLKLSRVLDELQTIWIPRVSVKWLVDSISKFNTALTTLRVTAKDLKGKVKIRPLKLQSIDSLSDLATRLQKAIADHAAQELENARTLLSRGFGLSELLKLSDFAADMDLLLRNVKPNGMQESELAQRFQKATKEQQQSLLVEELGTLAERIGRLSKIGLPRYSEPRINRAISALKAASESIGLVFQRCDKVGLFETAALHKNQLLACACEQWDAGAALSDGQIELDDVLATRDMVNVIGNLIGTIDPLDHRDTPHQLETVSEHVANVVVINVAKLHIENKPSGSENNGKSKNERNAFDIPDSELEELVKTFHPIKPQVLLQRFRDTLAKPKTAKALDRHASSVNGNPPGTLATIQAGKRLIERVMKVLVDHASDSQSRIELDRLIAEMLEFCERHEQKETANEN